jgi:hypothetical protein
MTTTDDDAHIEVFTFKDGLLSRVAHDLRLHAGRVALGREGEELVARVRVDALIVDGVIRDGRLDTRTLSARDRAKIVEAVRSDILDARRNPEIVFRGRTEADAEARVRVSGELELAGVRRALSFVARREGERLRASVTLTPSEFGIRPYKALAGAIRLQDRVRVEIDVAADVVTDA